MGGANMEWSVTYLPEKFAIAVRTKGEYTNEGLRAMITDILSDARWKPDMHAFFDHRELDLAKSDFDEMMKASGVHMEHDDHIGNGRAALLFSGDVNYGIGRIYESIMDGKSKAQIQVFTDEQEARKWFGIE